MANTATSSANTYLKLISQDEKKAKQGQLKLEAQKAYITVQNDVMKLKQSLFNLGGQLEAAKRAIPYNMQNEFKISENIATEQARLDFATAIMTDRFADAAV